MVITSEIIIILLAIIIVCSYGFKNPFWLISTGYGFSVATSGILLLILFFNNINLSIILSSLFLIVYGLRLSLFLIIRRKKSISYNKKMDKELAHKKKFKLSTKIIMWLSCSLLYLLIISSLLYRAINKSEIDCCFIVGLIIAILGLFIESCADIQKSKAKLNNPNRFCDSGLYKIVRCPNYFGEIVIWSGIFISGFTTLCSIWQLVASSIGYLSMVYIMFSGARRLELRQDRTYFDDKQYKTYKKKTPIIIPLIPLYSVKNHKWLVG
ncbi:MAG: DUF1295 domain-containing protein [Bacilli bacterium]|nr:DUF1295 domain-containing protein [Bacilli bacterium]